MRSLLAAALLAAAASAAPAVAGCTPHVLLPRVTVPAAGTSAGGTHVDHCVDPGPAPACANLVTTPGVTQPGVVEVTPLVVNDCLT